MFPTSIRVESLQKANGAGLAPHVSEELRHVVLAEYVACLSEVREHLAGPWGSGDAGGASNRSLDRRREQVGPPRIRGAVASG